MRTIAYDYILYAAAEASGGYTRDKIPPSVATLLHGYLTEGIRDIWRRKHAATWPELVTIEEVTLTSGAFTNNLGAADAEVIIVAVYDADPRDSAAAYKQEFENAGATIYVETDETTVWVEWMALPPNFTTMVAATRSAYLVPERMASYLQFNAAAKLAAADGNGNMAGVNATLAANALKREVDESGGRGRLATVLRN